MTAETSVSSQEALLENHLAFTSLHRGTVQRSESAIQIQSDLPGFTCLLPLVDATNPDIQRLLAAHSQARLLPWRSTGTVAIEQQGYAAQGALSYMVLGDLPKPTPTAGIEVDRAANPTDMNTFTEVQVAGFGSTGEEFKRWNRLLGEINLRNLPHPDQTFLIARLDGRPVGVTLLLCTEKMAGIYAVATLPEFRKRGVSSALLNRAVSEAKQRGSGTICLQVAQGSYAQSLYRSLGFSTAFDTPVFIRRTCSP